MTYKEARVYLDERSKYGSVLGLDTTRRLLRELQDPQNDLQFVHVAGTNGKGSVLAYTSTILSEAGYTTGRYVSPTVVSYLERIQVNGNWISEAEFAVEIEKIKKAIARMEARGEVSPTVFEMETAAAFLYFRTKKCDIVVLETGLGGALDATNIIPRTQVAAFTSISLDHMGMLGDTLSEIAANKAGIIKPGCTVVTAEQPPEVMQVLSERAKNLGCPFYVAAKEKIRVKKDTYIGQTFAYGDLEDLTIALPGEHQAENAAVALTVTDILRKGGWKITKQNQRTGLGHTIWVGRFTCIMEKPVFIIDGAHNVDAAKRLSMAVLKYFKGRRLLLIMGVFKDKEYRRMAEIMAPLAERIYTVSLPDAARTLSAELLKEAVSPYCKEVYAVKEIRCAVEDALHEAQETDVILACGSLSYLGAVWKQVQTYEAGALCKAEREKDD